MSREQMSKLYSRKLFKKGLERRLGGKKIHGNTDILMYLNFLVFLKQLAQVTDEYASEKALRTIKYEHINKNLEEILRKFRG